MGCEEFRLICVSVPHCVPFPLRGATAIQLACFAHCCPSNQLPLASHQNFYLNSRWPSPPKPQTRGCLWHPHQSLCWGPDTGGAPVIHALWFPRLSSEHAQQKRSSASRDQYINRKVRLNINRGRQRRAGAGGNRALQEKQSDSPAWGAAELHQVSTSPALSTQKRKTHSFRPHLLGTCYDSGLTQTEVCLYSRPGEEGLPSISLLTWIPIGRFYTLASWVHHA